MKYLLVITLLLSSCAHKAPTAYQKPYSDVLKDIPVNTEFGFVLDKKTYNFARVVTQQGDMTCDYFFGYKNGNLAYQFSTFEDKSLIKIFQEENLLNKKTRRILKHIEQVNILGKGDDVLAQKNCRNKSKYTESIGYFVVFSPFILMIMPVIIPKLIQDEINQKNIFNKTKSISLNQNIADVEIKLGSPLRANNKQGYRIFSYSWSAEVPVFANYFFEEDKLVGYFVGYDSRPQTVIEQTK